VPQKKNGEADQHGLGGLRGTRPVQNQRKEGGKHTRAKRNVLAVEVGGRRRKGDKNVVSFTGKNSHKGAERKELTLEEESLPKEEAKIVRCALGSVKIRMAMTSSAGR